MKTLFGWPWLQALLLGVLLAVAPQARADCVLDAPGLVLLNRYDPSAPSSPESWSLTIRSRKPKESCQARLQVEAPDSAGQLVLQGKDPAGLRILLSRDANGSQPVSVAPQDLGSFAIDAGEQTQLTLWALRGAGQWVEKGVYRSRVRVSLLDAQGKTQDQRNIDFQAQVHPSVQAQFGQASGAAGLNSTRMDFGELVQGDRQQAKLTVQSNSGYMITLHSTQRGRLVNRRFAQAQVPYLLRVDGKPIALGSSDAELEVARPGRQGHEIEVEIGMFERVLAGEYADTLLITITAQ